MTELQAWFLLSLACFAYARIHAETRLQRFLGWIATILAVIFACCGMALIHTVRVGPQTFNLPEW